MSEQRSPSAREHAHAKTAANHQRPAPQHPHQRATSNCRSTCSGARCHLGLPERRPCLRGEESKLFYRGATAQILNRHVCSLFNGSAVATIPARAFCRRLSTRTACYLLTAESRMCPPCKRCLSAPRNTSNILQLLPHSLVGPASQFAARQRAPAPPIAVKAVPTGAGGAAAAAPGCSSASPGGWSGLYGCRS